MVDEAVVRNYWLDYVLRAFQLDITNPYVNRPGFDEPRCLHCWYPNFAEHSPDCPWQKLRPLTEVLYPAPQTLTVANVVDESNIILTPPDEPTEADDDLMNGLSLK